MVATVGQVGGCPAVGHHVAGMAASVRRVAAAVGHLAVPGRGLAPLVRLVAVFRGRCPLLLKQLLEDPCRDGAGGSLADMALAQ